MLHLILQMLKEKVLMQTIQIKKRIKSKMKVNKLMKIIEKIQLLRIIQKKVIIFF